MVPVELSVCLREEDIFELCVFISGETKRQAAWEEFEESILVVLGVSFVKRSNYQYVYEKKTYLNYAYLLAAKLHDRLHKKNLSSRH
ncbi:hypothetical protein JTB14_000298 [Gonioctena quinquepunctata]|nr:hypothetical protein JTB14_000298 [Gonioctena quinquepunctata]